MVMGKYYYLVYVVKIGICLLKFYKLIRFLHHPSAQNRFTAPFSGSEWRLEFRQSYGHLVGDHFSFLSMLNLPLQTRTL